MSIDKSWVVKQEPKSSSRGSNELPKIDIKAGTIRIWKPRRWEQEPWGVLRHAPGFLTRVLFENYPLDHQLPFPDEETRARVPADFPSSDSSRRRARLQWVTAFSLFISQWNHTFPGEMSLQPWKPDPSEKADCVCQSPHLFSKATMGSFICLSHLLSGCPGLWGLSD